MSNSYYSPFMMPGADGEMTTLFSQVGKIMAKIDKGGKIKALKTLAIEW